MKKLIALLLAGLAMLSLAAPAAADSIWEPENGFYERHRRECTYENRAYELAGYDGSVTLWGAPNGTVLEEVPNGGQGTVQFRWSGDGVEWGYLYGIFEDWKDGGWVPMDDLTLIYDSRQFLEDHAAELVEGDPVPVEFDFAVRYAYPGGPVSGNLREHREYAPFSDVFSTLYTDENGLRWGYVSYYMGSREIWVCLDDPLNERLDTDIIAVEPSAAQLRGAPTVTPGVTDRLPLVLAGVLVVLVVVITLLVIQKVRPGKVKRQTIESAAKTNEKRL